MCICIEFVIQVLKRKNAHIFLPVGMVIRKNQDSVVKSFRPECWAVIWGVQNVWGEENVPENALS